MNNGKFLSLQDLGRFDLLMRSGAWQDWANHGWYPVVVAENITFRKSLKLFERFEIETKAVGWDDIAVYLEQRFVVKGEIYSRSIVRVRLLKRSRGNRFLANCCVMVLPPPSLPNFITALANARPSMPE